MVERAVLTQVAQDRGQSLLSSLLAGATLDRIMDLEPGPDPYPEGLSWDVKDIEFTKNNPWGRVGEWAIQLANSFMRHEITLAGYHAYPSDHTHHAHISVIWEPENKEEYTVLQVEWDNMTPRQQVETVRRAKSRGAPTAGPIAQPFHHTGRRRRRRR